MSKRSDGANDRPESPVPFEKLNQAATDLNVFNENAQVIGARCAAIANMDRVQDFRRRFFGK